MFVRKKKINDREYYYLVQSTRTGPSSWKKIERYIGLNPPSKIDLEKYGKEFDATKEFLTANAGRIGKILAHHKSRRRTMTQDALAHEEEEFIIRFTYDTQRIEGSSLTYKDTRLLLQQGITPSQKPLRDVKEAENHRQAYLFMKGQLVHEMTEGIILALHRMLKEGVTEDAGRFRNGQVRVGDLIPINHTHIKTEISNLLAWHKKSKTMHPLEQAATFHAIFERIHPFFDGNGRVGRLLLNFILLRRGYPPVIVQNKNRRRYYAALRKADGGNYLPLIKYLLAEIEAQTI